MVFPFSSFSANSGAVSPAFSIVHPKEGKRPGSRKSSADCSNRRMLSHEVLVVMRAPLFAFSLAVLAAAVAVAGPKPVGRSADNTLTASEKAAGWLLLFDGK